ncbi:MAG: A/G-specific adenine glycosylase [Burkholderiales bacterium]
MPSTDLADFAPRLVHWQKRHGRTTLPWQHTRDPYRVWLSEVMLQQTQVSTVLAYYPRFLQRFPTVQVLAEASQDDVLGLWSGLGYYSRARNLHRCAQAVVGLHGGQFPVSAQGLQTLPGIGRSTAAAIAAFCHGERVAILDGNVKRVLTRLLGFDGDLAQARNEALLWGHASKLLPSAALLKAQPAAMAHYTQGLMDLGASLCSRKNPQCTLCPASGLCQAQRSGTWHDFPVKTRKLKRTAQVMWLLLARSAAGDVWLHKRPSAANGQGIWAGLYAPPVFASRTELAATLPRRLQTRLQDGSALVHALTHKDLHLHPVWLNLPMPSVLAEAGQVQDGQWLAAAQWPALGLPAPVRQLLVSGPNGV